MLEISNLGYLLQVVEWSNQENVGPGYASQ